MLPESRYYCVNHLRLHVLEGAEKGGRAIVFLHGFPEPASSWRYYLNFFSTNGFHSLAPDQRGYGFSSKPPDVKDYTIDALVEDLKQLVLRVSSYPVVLVGHDWGGCIAWHFASRYPRMIERVAVINMPHPSVFRRKLETDPDQMRKSAYAAFFQLPYLPEWISGMFDFWFLRKSLKRSARPGTFPEHKMLGYRMAWQQAGAIRSMINWYRAFTRYPSSAGKVECPLLLLWGTGDQFLTAKMAEESLQWCKQGKLKSFDTASHWIHHEIPFEVATSIWDFIKQKEFEPFGA